MAESVTALVTAETETITATVTSGSETFTMEINVAPRGPDGSGGSGGVTSYVADIETLPDYPATFPVDSTTTAQPEKVLKLDSDGRGRFEGIELIGNASVALLRFDDLAAGNGDINFAYSASSETVAYRSNITKTAVGLGNVENTALSSWTGNTSQTSVGTITAGTWNGTAIALAYGGTGATSAAGAVSNLLVPYDEAATGTLTIDSSNAATYNGKFVRFTGATALALTIANTIPAGFNIGWQQVGAGQVTFTEGSGVTFQTYLSLKKTAGLYAMGSLVKTASGIFGLGGALTS